MYSKKTINPSKIFSDILSKNKVGFNLSMKLTKKDHSVFVNEIKKKFNKTFKSRKNFELYEYHKYCKNDELHATSWGKHKRILHKNSINKIKKTEIFFHLKNIFGDFKISDEENLGYENFIFRLVRPLKKNDIGPVHADYWFWDLNNYKKINKNEYRVKIWIPIYCKGENGLVLIPGSHKKKHKYNFKIINNVKKPIFSTELKIKKFDFSNKNIAIFHDKLLHGGKINESKSTRVSLEFTIIPNKQNVKMRNFNQIIF